MEKLINREPDMEKFAEANDSTEALTILKLDHYPDIVLMDVSLKTVSGFDVMLQDTTGVSMRYSTASGRTV
jgi:CheY-like chemotaxis protein